MALPLIVRAQSANLTHPRILKVIDEEEFVARGWQPETSALIANSPGLSKLEHLPWGLFLRTSIDGASSNRPTVWDIEMPEAVAVGDVIQVVPGRPSIRVLFRRGAKGNVLFATERCNSLCLMCSQPPREVDDRWRIRDNLELIGLIDSDASDLGITGGEPTLLGDGLLRLVEACRDQLPNTHLQVLTNGRLFSSSSMAEQAEALGHPNLQWNVPLYADVANIHDYVVQANGAFDQTTIGLYRLAEASQRVEIRVVLHKATIPRLPSLAKYIYRNFPFVVHVALMGVESVGFAKGNREALWIDPVDYQNELLEAVSFLAARGMAVSIYNLPLCIVPKALWPFARQSISDWKNSYLPACTACSLKARCGGFFQSVSDRWLSRGIQPFREGEIYEELSEKSVGKTGACAST